jgi:RES domain-containing protein
MIVYRIGHKNYITHFTASGRDGRWVSDGRMVIYCAATIELAFLENMVRRQGAGFNSDFKTMLIEIPDNLGMEIISAANLHTGWRNHRDYSFCQPIGNKWYDELKTPILRVPSVIIPESNNFVINTNHPDFNKIKIAGITNLVPDERIEDILKNYKKR